MSALRLVVLPALLVSACRPNLETIGDQTACFAWDDREACRRDERRTQRILAGPPPFARDVFPRGVSTLIGPAVPPWSDCDEHLRRCVIMSDAYQAHECSRGHGPDPDWTRDQCAKCWESCVSFGSWPAEIGDIGCDWWGWGW